MPVGFNDCPLPWQAKLYQWRGLQCSSGMLLMTEPAGIFHLPPIFQGLPQSHSQLNEAQKLGPRNMTVLRLTLIFTLFSILKQTEGKPSSEPFCSDSIFFFYSLHPEPFLLTVILFCRVPLSVSITSVPLPNLDLLGLFYVLLSSATFHTSFFPQLFSYVFVGVNFGGRWKIDACPLSFNQAVLSHLSLT